MGSAIPKRRAFSAFCPGKSRVHVVVRVVLVAGQDIEKGKQIGLSGATGRVNGPHLHWGIKVNDTYVDPLQFVDVIKSLLIE